MVYTANYTHYNDITTDIQEYIIWSSVHSHFTWNIYQCDNWRRLCRTDSLSEIQLIKLPFIFRMLVLFQWFSV